MQIARWRFGFDMRQRKRDIAILRAKGWLIYYFPIILRAAHLLRSLRRVVSCAGHRMVTARCHDRQQPAGRSL